MTMADAAAAIRLYHRSSLDIKKSVFIRLLSHPISFQKLYSYFYHLFYPLFKLLLCSLFLSEYIYICVFVIRRPMAAVYNAPLYKCMPIYIFNKYQRNNTQLYVRKIIIVHRHPLTFVRLLMVTYYKYTPFSFQSFIIFSFS